MNWLTTRFNDAKRAFRHDSLFRNAVFLMASTAIMSVLGFGFWVFVAHLYSPSEIGVASALISIAILISNLSLFGLNAGFVRFLPGSKNQSRDINAALATVTATTIVAATIYLLVGNDFTGHLAFFGENLWTRGLFVALMVAVSLNTLTDSVFIANRRTEYHTMGYAAFGLIKLVLPLTLVAYGSLGIFLAYIGAVLVSLVLSLFFMRRVAGHKLTTRPNWNFISSSRKYATNNYLAAIFSGLPSQIMPTLIIARLTQADAAYFSMAWTMASLLYVIPSAMTNSLLAEGSHSERDQKYHLAHAVRLLSLILIPAVLGAIVVAPFLLKLFGHQYSQGGTKVFQILALATFFIAANAIGSTRLNLAYRSSWNMLVQFVIAIVMLGLAIPFMKWGLPGVGLAMLTGQAVGAILQFILLHKKNLGASTEDHAQLIPSPEVIRAFMRIYDFPGAKVGNDLGGGDRSGTVILTVGDQKYVLKMYHATKRSPAELRAELDFTLFLFEQGVPVPTLVSNRHGGLISQTTTRGTTWSAVVMNYEPGSHIVPATSELLTNMARVQGKIHLGGIAYADQYHHVGHHNPTWRARLLNYLPKGFSHFDFDSWNILTDGTRIVCVLDFEGMRYDPIVICILYTLTHLQDRLHDRATLAAYLEAYQSVRRLSRLERLIIRVGLTARYRSPSMLWLGF